MSASQELAAARAVGSSTQIIIQTNYRPFGPGWGWRVAIYNIVARWLAWEAEGHTAPSPGTLGQARNGAEIIKTGHN